MQEHALLQKLAGSKGWVFLPPKKPEFDHAHRLDARPLNSSPLKVRRPDPSARTGGSTRHVFEPFCQAAACYSLSFVGLFALVLQQVARCQGRGRPKPWWGFVRAGSSGVWTSGFRSVDVDVAAKYESD